MSEIADCVAEIVQISRDHADGQLARQRVDAFFADLAEFVRPFHRDGSEEITSLKRHVMAASEQAARRGEFPLSERLERIVDYLRSKPSRLRAEV